MITFHDVLGFWFSSATRPNWFEKSDAFDAEVRRLLLPLHEQAASGRLTEWREHPQGCLALVIPLDQIPRNVFRDTPRAFASDPAALALTKLAIERGYDAGLNLEERVFLYLPLEHSEDLALQHQCVVLFEELERINDHPQFASFTRYAIAHRDVIARFGRFPHRNAVLQRQSTPDELAYLERHGGF